LHHSIVGKPLEVLAGSVRVRLKRPFGRDFGHFLLWTTLGNAIAVPSFGPLLKKHTTRAIDDEPKRRDNKRGWIWYL